MKEQPSFGLEIQDNVLLGIGECKDKDIVIPDNVVAIKESAFSFCEFIESVIIPDSVQFIGEAAFQFCKNLTSVQIGCGVGIIERFAFQECNARRIKVDVKNKFYDSLNDCNAIIETKTNKMIVGCDATTVPDGVEIIGKSIFEGGQFDFGFKKFRIPQTAKTIEENAFESCYALKEIEYNGTPEQFSKLNNLPEDVKVTYFSKDWEKVIG